MPWQHPRTPYRVWLSEIMLQQTQVATVIPYFERFIEQFDTVRALAMAPEDRVLHLWAGLGYYARARNLHKAAQEIVSCYGDEFPSTQPAWEALPGVGRSTAAAIIAQSFQKRAPILDGNVKRVLSRVCALDFAVDDSRAQETLWALADVFTPAAHATDYTQAIMDLGATVCTRQRPKCDQCPVSAQCEAFTRDTASEYPKKKPKKPKPVRSICFVLYTSEDHIWLEKRPAKGIWGGLWSLPEQPELPLNTAPVLAARHTFTHYHLDYQLALITIESLDTVIAPKGQWVQWAEVSELGLPAPIKKALHTVENASCQTFSA